MTRSWPVTLAMTVACFCLLAAPASAKWYGSTLRGKPNADYGCETALVSTTLAGIQPQPTNQRSLHLLPQRLHLPPAPHLPGAGHRPDPPDPDQVGPNPPRARLTVLTASSRVDTTTGQDIPGTYTCCTARYVSRPFRLKPNGITRKRVNVKVYNVRSNDINIRIHSSDGLALSFGPGGRLPLKIIPSQLGSFATGTPLSRGFWPRTGRGDPRVDGYQLSGIDLMFQWDFRRSRRR